MCVDLKHRNTYMNRNVRKRTFSNGRPTKTQISLHIRAVQSDTHSPQEQIYHLWLFKMRPVKILIRLRECAGWSESSLGHCPKVHLWLCGSKYTPRQKLSIKFKFYQVVIKSINKTKRSVRNDKSQNLEPLCCWIWLNPKFGTKTKNVSFLAFRKTKKKIQEFWHIKAVNLCLQSEFPCS